MSEVFKLTTPVAFFFFNRPETTEKVFNRIRKAKPSKLFLISDGPRSGNSNDFAKNEECRKIVSKVNWDCEVIKNYSEINLGCKTRISSGISWVFENTEQAIILEDDCLPVPSFFRFCQELLEYYRNDERVMMVSGNNFLNGRRFSDNSYYFSSYSYIWGWATWRRAWEKFDLEMKQWPEIKKQKMLYYWFPSRGAAAHWEEEFARTFEGRIDTWDFQFFYSCVINQGIGIIPEVNMVSNIGFGEGASHTADSSSKSANIPAVDIFFPLKHPDFIMRNLLADLYDERKYILPFHRRIVRLIKRLVTNMKKKDSLSPFVFPPEANNKVQPERI
jgi:hypothetical protein